MSERIVLTGATGNTGSVVADLLAKRSVPFVAMTRSAANREKLVRRGVEVIDGDFDQPKSLARALDGATKAYLVCTPDEKLIARETAFVAAAREAGVRHVVKCSAFAAGIDAPTQNLRSHGVIERALERSGMTWTVVRPHGFMQTFTLFAWDMITRVGVITSSAGTGAMPLVDVRDVAAVAVKALTETGMENRAYDVTGPEALRFDQMAEILARVLQRPVTYLPSGDASLSLMMRLLGTTDTPREHAVKIMQMVRAHRLETVHPTLTELGIRPTTYEEFVRDLVAGRTGGGNSFTPPDTLVFKVLSATMPLAMRLRLALSGRR